MRTSDWKYDYSSLPHWENRNSIPFIYDEFYELPKSNKLCCIYSIAEVSMCNYEGFLAILSNKNDPSLLLNVPKGINFCDNFSASDDERFIFLQPSMCEIFLSKSITERPILVIDLKNNKFSYISTGNFNPCYKIKQESEFVFYVEADEFQKNDKKLKELCETKINVKKLKWYDLDQIHSLPKMIFGK